MSDETVTSLLPAVQSNTQNNQGNECQICRRSFRTNRGLFQHLNTCRRRNTANLNVSSNSKSDENNDRKSRNQNSNMKTFTGILFLAGYSRKIWKKRIIK